MCHTQYTSHAAKQYKAALEKDLAKVNNNLATLPSSPTAAQAAKQGLDLLVASVSPLLRSLIHATFVLTCHSHETPLLMLSRL